MMITSALQPQPDGSPAASPPRPRRTRRFLLLLSALLVGNLAGFVAGNYLLTPHLSLLSEPIWLNILLFPLAVLLTAAMGPLLLVCCGLALARVQGGTPAAVCSLLLGVPLLYIALVWALRRWWKTPHPAARRLGWLAWALYSALSTLALFYTDFIT